MKKVILSLMLMLMLLVACKTTPKGDTASLTNYRETVAALMTKTSEREYSTENEIQFAILKEEAKRHGLKYKGSKRNDFFVLQTSL